MMSALALVSIVLVWCQQNNLAVCPQTKIWNTNESKRTYVQNFESSEQCRTYVAFNFERTILATLRIYLCREMFFCACFPLTFPPFLAWPDKREETVSVTSCFTSIEYNVLLSARTSATRDVREIVALFGKGFLEQAAKPKQAC